MKRRALIIAMVATATAVVVKLCRKRPGVIDPLPDDPTHPRDPPPNPPTGPK